MSSIVLAAVAQFLYGLCLVSSEQIPYRKGRLSTESDEHPASRHHPHHHQDHSGSATSKEHRAHAREQHKIRYEVHPNALYARYNDRGSSAESESHNHWDYTDTTKWHHDYPDCGKQHQSPINYDDNLDADSHEFGKACLYNLTEHYKARSGLKMINNGHTLEVKPDNGFGEFKLPDGDYELLEFNFHFPSEHTIGGGTAAGEMHLVHKRKDSDHIAVIAMFLEWESVKLGGDYARGHHRKKELDFFKNLGFDSSLPGKDNKIDIAEAVDIRKTFKHELEGPFLHYSGSLTTPPCTENVHWYVLRRPAAITQGFVSAFKDKFDGGNNRPIQALNDRQVVMSETALPAVSSEFHSHGSHSSD